MGSIKIASFVRDQAASERRGGSTGGSSVGALDEAEANARTAEAIAVVCAAGAGESSAKSRRLVSSAGVLPPWSQPPPAIREPE